AGPPSAPARGDGVPSLRRPLRQGRLPRRLPRSQLSVRLLVRGVGAHVRRLHAEDLRRRDRPRYASRRGAPPGRLWRDPRGAPTAADVQGGGGVDLRVAHRTGAVHQPGVRRAPRGAADVPGLRAAQGRLTRTTTVAPFGARPTRTVPGSAASCVIARRACPRGKRRRSSTAPASTRRETTVPPSARVAAPTARSAAAVPAASAAGAAATRL